MTAITRPDFLDGISRVSLRADNPDALAADLRAVGFRDEDAVYDAQHHLLDHERGVHFLVYRSGVAKAFAPSWVVLRPVISNTAERGLAR